MISADHAPTLTNKSTASAWRICIRRSSDHTIASDLRLVFYSRDQWYPTVGVLPGRGFVPIIGPVYGVDVDPSAGFINGDGFIFSSSTIWLEISETELKFTVGVGRSSCAICHERRARHRRRSQPRELRERMQKWPERELSSANGNRRRLPR